MRFPDIEALTPDQQAKNEAAASKLVPGTYYRFDPPVTATAIPTGGAKVTEPLEVQFETGWYLGFVEGKHVFQGKPINDPRIIPVPKGYEDSPNIVERLRESYFHTLFVDEGSIATPIPAPQI